MGARPTEFINLLEKKVIEQEHFNKAKERTQNFKGMLCGQSEITDTDINDLRNCIIVSNHDG